MALDGIAVCALVNEFNNRLCGGRIDKIYQPEKDEIVLSIRTQNESYRLLLSANSNTPRIHITENNKSNPEVAPMFCMLLRKHIGSGRIVSFSQPDFERVIKIEIEGYNELGDLTVKHLIIEIMSRHSNIILVNSENLIMDSIKHVDLTVSSMRQVLPNLFYSYPPSQDKLNPLAVTKVELSNAIMNQSEGTKIDNAILNSVMGISPLISRELCVLAIGTSDAHVSELSEEEIDKISDAVIRIYNETRENKISPCVISDLKTGKYMDFASVNITQYQGLANVLPYEYVSLAMDEFYTRKDDVTRLDQKKAEILKVINTNLERCYKKTNIQLKSIKEAENREVLKTFGELLSANIYKLSSGMKEILVENYYDPELATVKIPLDPKLNPARNVQRYFTRYNKAKTTEIEAKKQLEITEEEVIYLESVKDSITRCESVSDISEIKAELADQGYIKLAAPKKKVKKTNKKSNDSDINPLKFISSDGFSILVGKNNKQNDVLSLRVAKNNDMWFHTKSIHGSHTIVQSKYQEEIPERTIIEAATIAAYHSKAREGQNVPVDYTLIKNVKKPSGAKPGMVIYEGYNTVYVTPDKGLVERLKES